MKSKVLAEPVLVGRDRELEELQRHLDLAFEGNGSTVFISGEAGSGKTRLSNEFLNLAKEKGVTILSGWCLSGAAVPYFPFVEAFESYPPNGGEESSGFAQQQGMKTWFAGPSHAEQLGTDKVLNAQMWKDQTFAAVTKELLVISSTKPTILFIDDIHWADSASLALLHYIARSINSERILVLATFRSEEIDAKNEGRLHPLTEALRLMSREGLFEEIKLRSLGQHDVGKIVESMLGSNLAPNLIEKLTKESRGNPLFVVESLRTMHSQGSLVQEQGRWRLLNDKIGFPAKVKDVILRRLDMLDANQRGILDAASVVGEKFDPRLLTDIVSQNTIEILKALNGIERATLLVFGEGDSYKFIHAKIREMLFDDIPVLLKREYHSRIAEKMEAGSKKSEELPFSDIAYHYKQGGNKEKAVEYALAAGRDARERFSNLEAINHFIYVVQALENDALHSGERTIAIEELGDAYYANCMFEDAIRTFENLAASETGNVRLRALRKEMQAVWYKDMDIVRLMEIVKRAEKYASDDRLENARVRWNRGRALFWTNDTKASLQDHEEALRVFKEEYSLLDAAWVLWGTGAARIKLGSNHKQGIVEILRGTAMLHELGDIRGEALASYHGVSDNFFVCGLFPEGFSSLSNALKIGEAIGDFDIMARALSMLSSLPETMGDLKTAIAQSLKALEFSEKTDSQVTKCEIYAKLARQYALQGDLEKADGYYARFMGVPEEVRANPQNLLSIAYNIMTFFAIKNRWEEANRAFAQGAEAILKLYPSSAGFNFMTTSTRSWLLGKQGKQEEAAAKMEEANQILEAVNRGYEHSDIKAELMARKEVFADEEFEIRLDFVNVGRKTCLLVKIEDLVVPEFKVVTPSPHGNLQNGHLEPKEKSVHPFKAETIKLRVKSSRNGTFRLAPHVIFMNDLAETENLELEPISIIVKPAPSTTREAENVPEPESAKLEFKSVAAQKTFDFLIIAFKEDYERRRLPREKSGWRTLMDVVKQGHVSQYSVYGSSGRSGLAISELKRFGAVEVRMFVGERGRGGKIMKVRVAAEKENIKQRLNEKHSSSNG